MSPGSSTNSPHSPRHGATRGQTIIDFLIAMTLFIAALTVALSVVGPFVTGDLIRSDTTPQASHTATYLATTELAATNSPTPSTLDTDATIAFFSRSDSSLSDDLPLAPSIEANTTLTYHGTPPLPLPYRETGTTNGRFTRGPTPPRAGTAAVNRTTVLAGHQVTLTVTTWRTP